MYKKYIEINTNEVFDKKEKIDTNKKKENIQNDK